MRSAPEKPVEVWGGLECTINRVGNEYFDQLGYAGHRDRHGDMELFHGLGISKMRYPILWEHHKPFSDEAGNWDDVREKLQFLHQHNISVIAGLVHHGSGPGYANIIDSNFARGLARYAGEVAEHFPWIEHYTPVNEPLTTARFCGLYGLWHPHEKTDAAFCRILVNECKATVTAMSAIRKINPKARLIQTEDLGKVHSTSALKYQADFENERRWLTGDLLCGRIDGGHPLQRYLLASGIGSGELDFFADNPCPPDILGLNYYMTSERYLDENLQHYPEHTHGGNGTHRYADVEVLRVGGARPDGLKALTKEALGRYGIPVAVTEVHLNCSPEEQMRWLNEVWMTANELTSGGVPVVAICPWALLGSFGWDRLLSCEKGTYEAGVFDISSGEPRHTILAEMIKSYARNEPYDHPALLTPGWWHRDSRVCYAPAKHSPASAPDGDVLIMAEDLR